MVFSKCPSLKLIDQKMYENQEVISKVEHSITFLTIVWKLRSKPGHRVFQSTIQRESPRNFESNEHDTVKAMKESF